MAQWLVQQRGEKVAVVVPSEVLAVTQQDKYAPWANRVYDDLWRADVVGVFYCTYNDFLTGRIPLNTVLLVDEVDSLFFNDKPAIRDGKFISSVLLLNKYRVLGMSATFRGDQGRDKIVRLLRGCVVIKTTDIVQERVFRLDIFGSLSCEAILTKAVELAKEKQVQGHSVIIMLPSISACESLAQNFEGCIIFGRGDTGEQVNCLKELHGFES
eukprot:CAMPEP_0202977714 /NCGR_PEP_ID=MMETSP1396-20130829/84411_1 /ASSEMBLY_ACC=CAM_ASM_000872 /TAXON_ID= /ORGANISM="Pseudokeronopsis sp., Strain Brazil" /LENGTH=212 /DNA_ID=CAMNT_0049716509 /DNA_START=1813 /DNA_END=2451 /DNA_ORIENTATION=-